MRPIERGVLLASGVSRDAGRNREDVQIRALSRMAWLRYVVHSQDGMARSGAKTLSAGDAPG